jgi:hypothetical protein
VCSFYFVVYSNYRPSHSPWWAEQRSRYSDWLRAGRSGNRIPVGAKFSAPVQTGPWTHPASCITDTGSFPGVKSGRGVTRTPHPLLVPWSRRGKAILLPPPLHRIGRTACIEPQCPYKGALYFFFLHSPCPMQPCGTTRQLAAWTSHYRCTINQLWMVSVVGSFRAHTRRITPRSAPRSFFQVGSPC